jgi:hypothetical protein
VDRERDENKETGEQEFHATPPGGALSLVFGWARRQVRFAWLSDVTPRAVSAGGGA